MSQIGYWEQDVRSGYYSPSHRPERIPNPCPIGSLGGNMAKAQDPCPIGPNELRLCLRHVADGNFKEFYRAAVSNTDGDHAVTLVNVTWAGCGPEDFDGAEIMVKVQGGTIIKYRWPDEVDWREYDEDE